MTPAVLAKLFPLRKLLAASQGKRALTGKQRSHSTIAAFALAFLAVNGIALLSMDVLRPELRDPEYGRRTKKLKARIAENPHRPVAIVIGSSRAAMGITPAAWEQVRTRSQSPDPLVFNMSLVGSGPVIELFCLRRLYADGFKPDVVVFEYWPAFLREDGPYRELDRIDANRFYSSDRGFIRDYAEAPEKVEREMLAARWNPIYENRFRWLTQAFPSWLPWTRRMDVSWAGVDDWGWLPGVDEGNLSGPITREVRLKHCENIYRNQQFKDYSIHPTADRALREAVALARANGAKVAFVWLPESSEFRSWMPPTVEAESRAHLDRLCRELDVPLIDSRFMMPDDALADGFHLTRTGAEDYTRRFVPALAATFPDLGKQP
jgi:hypothetical protein